MVFPSSVELGPVLAQLVTSRAQKAIASHGRFTLGLSGGSLVSMLSKELLAMGDLDCSKWVVGFCDERVVSFDDPESTYGLYKVTVVYLHALWSHLLYFFGVKCNHLLSFLVSFPESVFF